MTDKMFINKANKELWKLPEGMQRAYQVRNGDIFTIAESRAIHAMQCSDTRKENPMLIEEALQQVCQGDACILTDSPEEKQRLIDLCCECGYPMDGHRNPDWPEYRHLIQSKYDDYQMTFTCRGAISLSLDYICYHFSLLNLGVDTSGVSDLL